MATISALGGGAPQVPADPAHEGFRLLVNVSFLSSSQSSSGSYSQCRLLSAQQLDVDDGDLSVETVKGKPGLKNLIIETKEVRKALQSHIKEVEGNEKCIELLARIMLQEQILREMYRSKDVTLVEARFKTFSSLDELKNNDDNLGVIDVPVKKVLKDAELQIENLIRKKSLIDSKVRMSVGGGPPQTSVEKMVFFDKFTTTQRNEEKVNTNFNKQKVLVFMQEKGDSRHDADPMKPSGLKTGFKYSKRFFQGLLLGLLFPVKAPYNKVCSKDKTWLGIFNGRFPTDEEKIGDLKKMFQEFS
jgi:hypothetical protein